MSLLAETEQAEVHRAHCIQCGKDFRALTRTGAQGALTLHLQRVHKTSGPGGRRTPTPPAAPAAPAMPAAPPSPAAKKTVRAAESEEGPHQHNWRLLKPSDVREAKAIRQGYSRYCGGCGEVER